MIRLSCPSETSSLAFDFVCTMQTLYLVLHEKQTCSDLQSSVMMVILLQMNLNNVKKKTKTKRIIYMTSRLTEEQTRQFGNHRDLQSFQFLAKN